MIISASFLTKIIEDKNMSIEVIPAGASAVVTDNNQRQQERWVELMEAIKDAQAQDVETTKDAQAHLAELIKDAQAQGVEATKDAEAGIERSMASSFQNVIQDVKDAESRLMKDAGDKFINTIQDIKDAETRLTKDLNDNFIQTVQDIKEAARDTALASAHTVETVKDSGSYTREVMDRNFRESTKELYTNFERTNKYVDETRRELGLLQERALKEELVTQYKLHSETEKRGYETQKELLKGFSESELRADRHAAAQALLSEKLAAQAAAKAAECCCEIKEKIAADGQKTRDLINSITEQNLRDRAAKAEAGLAAYFAAKVPPTVPVI